MRTVLMIPTALIAMLLSSFAANAQSVREGWLTPQVARRVGLERAWFLQLRLNPSRHKLQDLRLHVSNTKATMLYEVLYDGGKIVFSEHDINPLGEQLGKEGAKVRAEKEVEALKQQNQEAKLEMRLVPQITLYAMGSGGLLQAVDAETGNQRWSATIGSPRYPTSAPGVSDTHVAAVNGGTLYVLDAETGSPLWNQPLKSAPGGGPAISDTLVFVPMMNGKVQVYELDDPSPFPKYFQSHGRAIIQPTATPTSVVWPTNIGHVHFSDTDQLRVRFRLEAHNEIVAPVTYRSPNMVLTSSLDGYVYAVHDLNGTVLWRFSTGEPISQKPIPVDDVVYIVGDHNNLYRVGVELGDEQWSIEGVDEFLAATPERVYVLNNVGQVEVLDAKSGGRLANLPTSSRLFPFANATTDRLYLATQGGLIQCFREQQSDYPIIHGGWEPPKQETTEAEGEQPQAPQPSQPTTPPLGSDPFGQGNQPAPQPTNPFAPTTPAAPPGAAPDPFENPFE